MSVFTDWLKGRFTRVALKPAAPSPEQENALRLMTRRKLEEFSQGPQGDAERYISVRLFLEKLQGIAKHSSLNHPLGMSPQTVYTGARTAIMMSATGAKVPFFYPKDENKKDIHAEDMFVPVRFLADHALSLLNDNHAPVLASLYADTLEGQRHRTYTHKGLLDSPTLAFSNKENMQGQFEMGAVDDPDYARPEIILRPRKADDLNPL